MFCSKSMSGLMARSDFFFLLSNIPLYFQPPITIIVNQSPLTSLIFCATPTHVAVLYP